MADEEGKYDAMYLSSETRFVVDKGSYAESFLKGYKPKYEFAPNRLVVVYSDNLSFELDNSRKELS